MKTTTFSELLDEGLIRSYPTKNFTAQLQAAFEHAKAENAIVGFKMLKDASLIDVHSDKDSVSIQFMLSDGFSLDDLETDYLSRDLVLFGWYIGNKAKKVERIKSKRWPHRLIPIETHIFVFEPKFPLDNEAAKKFSEKTIAKYKVFYHMTFEKFKQKIEKNGLVPNFSDREHFKYPERIYLFTDKDFAEQFARYHVTPEPYGGKKHKDEIEKRKIGNTGEFANLKYQKKDQDILIYEVDLEKLAKSGKEVLLYHDSRTHEPNASDITAVFTYNTIPTKFLKLIETIKL